MCNNSNKKLNMSKQECPKNSKTKEDVQTRVFLYFFFKKKAVQATVCKNSSKQPRMSTQECSKKFIWKWRCSRCPIHLFKVSIAWQVYSFQRGYNMQTPFQHHLYMFQCKIRRAKPSCNSKPQDIATQGELYPSELYVKSSLPHKAKECCHTGRTDSQQY